MNLGLITHSDCERHQIGRHHPECPERLGAIHDRLIASGVEILLRHYLAPMASRQQLERVHDPEYVETLFEPVPEGDQRWLDGDTAMNHYTLDAALRAAGAAVRGVDLVMSGEVESVFAAVRPPGHHAERARAMGFCFFNNVAVAAAHALEAHQLERVAIVDFDVHHGNGTEAIFRHESRVLFCSSFQHPFYPHTPFADEPGHIVNAPLPAGCDGEAFQQAITTRWLPALEAFAPELILISAGFDGHLEDDMAQFALIESDYAWITVELRKLAERHASGRIVSILEGGYALEALGRSVTQHIQALMGH